MSLKFKGWIGMRYCLFPQILIWFIAHYITMPYYSPLDRDSKLSKNKD